MLVGVDSARALTLQLGLACNGVAVDLITTTNHAVVGLLVVIPQHVLPQRVVARLELGALEVVGVDT